MDELYFWVLQNIQKHNLIGLFCLASHKVYESPRHHITSKIATGMGVLQH